MAPELFMKRGGAPSQYDSKAVDIYAMGICLFKMLNLAQPYPADNKNSTVQKIIRQDISYQVQLSSQCRELISSMLRIDPGRRPKADDVAKSEWLEQGVFKTVINALFGE